MSSYFYALVVYVITPVELLYVCTVSTKSVTDIPVLHPSVYAAEPQVLMYPTFTQVAVIFEPPTVNYSSIVNSFVCEI